jgi:hypothetical protein
MQILAELHYEACRQVIAVLVNDYVGEKRGREQEQN